MMRVEPVGNRVLGGFPRDPRAGFRSGVERVGFEP